MPIIGNDPYLSLSKTDAKKLELFGKVRSGQVRVLMGSTQKMGAGTNVQKLLIALHDLDCPWRPSDLEQRLGRIVRQKNDNPEVEIYRYVTEGTFDSYLYQLVENKQRFISQIMTSKTPLRAAEDVDEASLNYAEIKALATGNPLIIEKCQLEMEVGKLTTLRASYLNQKYELEEYVIRKCPREIQELTATIQGYEKDAALVAANPTSSEHFPPMELLGTLYTEKEEAGRALIQACLMENSSELHSLGQYRGFDMSLHYDSFGDSYILTFKGTLSYTVELGGDTFGNITRIDNLLSSLESKLSDAKQKLEYTKMQLETAKSEMELPFSKEDELNDKTSRLKQLNILLNMDQKDKVLIDTEPEQEDSESFSAKKERAMVR